MGAKINNYNWNKGTCTCHNWITKVGGIILQIAVIETVGPCEFIIILNILKLCKYTNIFIWNSVHHGNKLLALVVPKFVAGLVTWKQHLQNLLWDRIWSYQLHNITRDQTFDLRGPWVHPCFRVLISVVPESNKLKHSLWLWESQSSLKNWIFSSRGARVHTRTGKVPEFATDRLQTIN